MKFIKSLLILSLLAAPVGFSSCQKQETDQREIMAAKLQNVNRITFARMHISKLATIDDLQFDKANGLEQKAEALLDMLKIGDRKAAYSYNTYLEAYMDMDSFSPEDIEIDPELKTAVITLPEIKTHLVGRDMQLKEEHYRVSGLRSSITPKERAEMKELMNAQIKQEISSNSDGFKEQLIEKARMKAESYFTNLFKDFGYQVTIRFK